MKRSLVIAVGLVLTGFALLLLHEHAHYTQRGQTQVDLRFLGFTNSSVSSLRLARFAVSNMSPWPVVQGEYPNSETHRKAGDDIRLTHSFVGGPRIWQAHESGVALVHLNKFEDQERWRVIATFDRYEDSVVASLHRWRFFLSDYAPLKVPRRNHIKVVTEWNTE